MSLVFLDSNVVLYLLSADARKADKAEALLAQQHPLSFYDAHIVSAAIQSGASTLMSEDMHEGLVVGPIKIQNPFAVS